MIPQQARGFELAGGGPNFSVVEQGGLPKLKLKRLQSKGEVSVPKPALAGFASGVGQTLQSRGGSGLCSPGSKLKRAVATAFGDSSVPLAEGFASQVLRLLLQPLWLPPATVQWPSH